MTSLLRLKPHCFRLDDGVGGSTQPLGKEAIADVDLDPDSLSKVEEAFISAVLFWKPLVRFPIKSIKAQRRMINKESFGIKYYQINSHACAI